MQTLHATVSTSVFSNNQERVAQTSDVHSSQRTKGTDMDASKARGESGTSSHAVSAHVVYDLDKQAHRIWLNVIDPQSGQIMYKIPPQAVRDLLDTLSSCKSSSFNMRS
jgi:uncharacterized FlaG/YvyC family protein